MAEITLTELSEAMRRALDIRDRKYRGRLYLACFVGSEAVDWLLESRYAPSRDKAIELGNSLVEAKKLHHVVDQHSFKVCAVIYNPATWGA